MIKKGFVVDHQSASFLTMISNSEKLFLILWNFLKTHKTPKVQRCVGQRIFLIESAIPMGFLFQNGREYSISRKYDLRTYRWKSDRKWKVEDYNTWTHKCTFPIRRVKSKNPFAGTKRRKVHVVAAFYFTLHFF